MRVTRARLFAAALPLREPFTISGGSMAVRRSLIVELTSASGHVGYGESAPFEQPFYSSETVASARACLLDLLLPAIVGWSGLNVQACHDLLGRLARGNRMARAGVETAWWDLQAAEQGLALCDLVSRRLSELGVPGESLVRRDYLECGVALGIPPEESPDVLRAWIRDALERGYRRLKLKVRPGWDVAPVRIAQEELTRAGRSLPLWVDANGAYDLASHRQDLEALDRLGLLFIEQPLAEDAMWDSRELGRIIRTPVCFDESLTSDDVARQVLAMDGPRIWNVKIQRLGGLEESCRVYARAVVSGVALWGGTMPETGIGAQAMLALGGHAGFVFPSDIEPSERWYAAGSDLVDLQMTREGTMEVPRSRPAIALDHRVQLLADLEC